MRLIINKWIDCCENFEFVLQGLMLPFHSQVCHWDHRLLLGCLLSHSVQVRMLLVLQHILTWLANPNSCLIEHTTKVVHLH